MNEIFQVVVRSENYQNMLMNENMSVGQSKVMDRNNCVTQHKRKSAYSDTSIKSHQEHSFPMAERSLRSRYAPEVHESY